MVLLVPAVQNVADAGSDLPTAKVLIGGTATTPSTDAAPGILVLGDNTKAMILPRVGSIADIVNPSAGMMVYVTGANNNGTDPNANQLAVFNGREWAFWSKQ